MVEVPTGRPVSVGLFLTHQQTAGTDPLAALADQLGLLRAARDAGYDSVFAGQHHVSDPLAHFPQVPWLARLAAEAGHLRVGAGVHLLALHNPVDTAENYAALDVLAGGRAIFGVGLGYRDAEFDAFGVPRDQRLRRYTENLRIVRALWAGEEVTVDLPWCRLDGFRLTLPPAGRPPVWMAANADAGVRRAAREADTWMINPHATGETVRRQLGIFHAERAAAGLDPVAELPIIREVFCAPTREQAVERAAPHLAAKYEVYADTGQDKVLPDGDSFRTAYAELAADRFVVGTPDDVLAALLPWRDELGVDHFVLRTDWAGMPAAVASGSVELLAAEVLPVLRSG